MPKSNDQLVYKSR